jgi:hypothetical protein
MKIKLKKIKSSSGDLGIIEKFPFQVKRIYYLNNTSKNSLRNGHAHKKLNQILICLHGKVQIDLQNKNRKQKKILIKNQHIIIKGLTWRKIKVINKDSILLVLASDIYKKSDYIRDYEKFLNIVNKKY